MKLGSHKRSGPKPSRFAQFEGMLRAQEGSRNKRAGGGHRKPYWQTRSILRYRRWSGKSPRESRPADNLNMDLMVRKTADEWIGQVSLG